MKLAYFHYPCGFSPVFQPLPTTQRQIVRLSRDAKSTAVPWCDLIFMQCKNGHRISKHSQVVEGGLHHLPFGGLSITSLLASLVGDMHLALGQLAAKCEAAKMTDSTS